MRCRREMAWSSAAGRRPYRPMLSEARSGREALTRLREDEQAQPAGRELMPGLNSASSVRSSDSPTTRRYSRSRRKNRPAPTLGKRAPTSTFSKLVPDKLRCPCCSARKSLSSSRCLQVAVGQEPTCPTAVTSRAIRVAEFPGPFVSRERCSGAPRERAGVRPDSAAANQRELAQGTAKASRVRMRGVGTPDRRDTIRASSPARGLSARRYDSPLRPRSGASAWA